MSAKTKFANDLPEWKELAKKCDDMQYILLTYGKSFTKKTLLQVQKEFHNYEGQMNRLNAKLEKQGYWFLT